MISSGQLKNLAKAAFFEFQQNLPGGIGPMGSSQTGGRLQSLINSFSNENNDVAVTVGQLKFVALRFYDRLIEVRYTREYPWSNSPHPPDDYALANIGQAKNLFGFDLNRDRDADGLRDVMDENPDYPDRDEDGLLDGLEIAAGTDPLDRDTDDDGLSDAEELANGTNPTVWDTDNDGVGDGEDRDGVLYAPRNLTAAASTADSIRLTWQDGGTGSDSFILERRGAGSAPWQSIAAPDGTTFTFLDTGLEPTNYYDYRAKAVKGGTTSAPSNLVTITTTQDSDSDGMPDWWEVLYSFNPDDPSDANENPDRDHLKNAQEFYAGTNPRVFNTHESVPDATPETGAEIWDAELTAYEESFMAPRSPTNFVLLTHRHPEPEIDDTAEFRWNDNSNNEIGFVIEFKPLPGHWGDPNTPFVWNVLVQLPANVTSYSWVIPKTVDVWDTLSRAPYRVSAIREKAHSPSNSILPPPPRMYFYLFAYSETGPVPVGEIVALTDGQQIHIGDNQLQWIDPDPTDGEPAKFAEVLISRPCYPGQKISFSGSISTAASFSFRMDIPYHGGPVLAQNQGQQQAAGLAEAAPHKVRITESSPAQTWHVTVAEPTDLGRRRPQVIGEATILVFELIDGRNLPWAPGGRPVRWFTSQLQSDGATWGEWRELGRGARIEQAMPGRGIYQVGAAVGSPGDDDKAQTPFLAYTESYLYQRLGDELFMEQRYGPGVAGAPDAIGVASRQFQGTVIALARPFATRRDGSYAESESLPGWPAPLSKCNKFVGDMCRAAGANMSIVPVNTPEGYPMANQWAGASSSFPVSHATWPRLGLNETIEPGFVVAMPRDNRSGHVGIVDYDGVAIAAGSATVNKMFGFYDPNTPGRAGASRHRHYRGGN